MKVNGVQNNNKHWATFQNFSFVLYRRKNINVYKWSQNFRFCVNYPFKSISDKDSLPNVKRVSLML